MSVPFLDLRAAHAELRDELRAQFDEVLEGGRFILGERVERFEHAFAAACGAAACVGVNSGLDALRVALEAGEIGAGDEVLVPAHTFIATWLAVSQLGAEPVPVAVREDTANLDPEALERAISPRTRAVVPVHLYGQPAEMDPIAAVARAHGLLVVEDAAQAHGARYNGREVGTLGHVAAFSFYPGKNLGALGDGGAIVTDDLEFADRCRVLRNYGSRKKYEHERRGTNTRLDELQAALLEVKLGRLEAWNARRRQVAARYLDGLANSGVVLPHVLPGCEPSWHLFVVRCLQRDRLQRALAEAGVETLIHYPTAPHQTGAYAGMERTEQVRVAERLAAEVLSLPIGPHLDDADVEHVIAAVHGAA